MGDRFPDHFSQVASAYRAYRPGYPAALFAWLAGLVERHEAALDCGCGSGQASVALAQHFATVFAVDPGEGQIRQAKAHPRVRYRVAPAEATGLSACSIDLAVAAQALHWFDLDRFYPELRRVARGGSVFAAFTYGLIAVDERVDAALGRLYHEVLRGWWPPERAHVDAAYRTLPFPFPAIAAPAFTIEATWSFEQLLGYLGTWSGVSAYRKRTGHDPVAEVMPVLREAWGELERPRRVTWPLAVRAGRIG